MRQFLAQIDISIFDETAAKNRLETSLEEAFTDEISANIEIVGNLTRKRRIRDEYFFCTFGIAFFPSARNLNDIPPILTPDFFKEL